MTKQEIHRRFVEQLTADLQSITTAAKNTIATAKSEEHHAESKYDTFSLESSYLARGQAQRVEELHDALDRLQALPLKDMDEHTPVQLGALIRLTAEDGEQRTLFFGPAAGGETLVADGEEIMIITSSSPLGRALLGKTTGDEISLNPGAERQHFTILSVE